ncbi:hypothetical protein D557_3092 [Bordetella holmesii 70147]|nr:hypothetical protein D555_3859 [Bordetella holmesii 35009]EWM45103.1 hypothetical protein D557_3092 [Bordetella holmesii 70147]
MSNSKEKPGLRQAAACLASAMALPVAAQDVVLMQAVSVNAPSAQTVSLGKQSLTLQEIPNRYR